MENYKTKNLPDLIDKIHVAEAQQLLPQEEAIGPINRWQEKP